MSKPSETSLRTKVVAQIASWEGEATFDRVRVAKRGKDMLVVELIASDGSCVEVSFPPAGLKNLISWRMLMNL